MSKLGITLKNGYKIKPVVLDCCLGIDGLGPPGLFGNKLNKVIDKRNSTTILKSITRESKIGNFAAPFFSKEGWAKTNYWFLPYLPKKLCFVPLRNNSTVNSYGLSNEGFDNFLDNLNLDNDKTINISIFLELGDGSEEAIKKARKSAKYMAQKISTYHKKRKIDIGFVVLNISCPNAGNAVTKTNEKIVEVVKQFDSSISEIPYGIKYSYIQDVSLAVELENHCEIAFHQAINTIPFKLVYGENKFSPLSHIGHGGVSGKDITQKALEYGKKLYAEKGKGNLKAPIILCGGIMTLGDAMERSMYADAIAMGILVNKNPELANDIINYFIEGEQ